MQDEAGQELLAILEAEERAEAEALAVKAEEVNLSITEGEPPSIDDALALLRSMRGRVLMPDLDTKPSQNETSTVAEPSLVTGYADHPYANLFPLMSSAELRELATDIKANGQQEPILLYEDLILDGRNRYRACKLAGVEPKTEQWVGKGSALDYVVSLNLHRRHLSEVQKVTIALQLKEGFAIETSRDRLSNLIPGPKLRQDPVSSSGQICPLEETAEKLNNLAETSRDHAAHIMGVSPRAISKLAVVMRTGVPDLVAMTKAGQVSLDAAALVATLPTEEQTVVFREGLVKETAKKIRNEKGGATLPKALQVRYRAACAAGHSAEAETAIAICLEKLNSLLH